ncbi:nucleoside kinase [Traorella massiliensis]|uniref:nucleoside kinase n=1 Tax=Traorella massiliensis TaxID=1903263 RepID=UPI0009F71241|nr:nucleoside kinase [Traorella massiliensis]
MIVNIVHSKNSYSVDVEKGIRAEQLYLSLNEKRENKVLLCKVDNSYRDLNHKINQSCSIEFLDMSDNYAWLVYQNSLILLYEKAVYDILGNVQVNVSNSLNKGLYTTIKGNVSADDIAKIEKRMKELVNAQLPIIKERIQRKELLKLSSYFNSRDRSRLILSSESIQAVEVYSLDSYKELFYGLLVPNTSYLQYFELKKYRNGILLRYPHISQPNEMPPYEDQKLLYDAFSEATIWEKLMNVSYVADLNEKIKNNDYQDLIMLQEALHEKKISDIANQIKQENKRIILICGPSSSGKTSFAKRLCIQMRVIGLRPLYLGTDDYFVERSETVLDENGEKDYESIRAVDIDLFNQQINELLNGQKVDIPTFDFINGTKVFGQRIVSIDKNQPIVIEGIHALNQILTRDIDDAEKFKIYISPLTSLNIDHINRIPTTDARMLRRLVRDHQFRGRPASQTICDWPKVRKGEDQNIFPFIDQADIFFNTNYIYELAVLKKYAEPLLESVQPEEKEYAEAQRMLSFLRFFEKIEDDSAIANQSILREFIGGSILLS